MKKLFNSIVLGTTLLVLAPGCKNPKATSVQVETVIIKSVDVAMNVWHDYVVANKPPQSKIDNVHAAYNYYYNSQLIAKAALEQWVANTNPTTEAEWVQANQAVTEASNSVIQLVKLLMK